MTENCQYQIEGKLDGQTLVFIHGWPDNAGLWHKQVAELGGEYRCVLLTLPNFGDQSVNAGGFDFPQLVEMINITLEEVLAKGEHATLITHDWGAYIGYMLEQAHPYRIEKMIALDVGGHAEPGGAKQVMFIVGYQWTLVLLWLIGGLVPPLGNWLTRQFARLLGVRGKQRTRIRSRFNYPYFYLWRGMLLPAFRKNILQRYTPGCPVLYLWGKNKPVMFHSSRWLDLVSKSGGHSKGIEGAGHWLQLSHADQVNHAMRSFLKPKQDL